MHPDLLLGVPRMDADHAALAAMFDRVATTPDDGLLALWAEIEAEVIAHFAREDVLMAEAGVPVLQCHRKQHALLLDRVAALRPTAATPPAEVRRRLAGLGEQVETHVDGVDRVTSRFLRVAPAAAARAEPPRRATANTGA